MDLVRIGKVIFGGSVITERLHIDVKQDLKKKKKRAASCKLSTGSTPSARSMECLLAICWANNCPNNLGLHFLPT